MPLPAWSLLGFLNEAEAIKYMQDACIMPNHATGALRSHFQRAKKRLGNGAVAHPGKPDMQSISPEHEMYLQGVQTNPRFSTTIRGRRMWSFKLVEIEPLIAWQLHVLVDKVDGIVSAVTNPPSMEEMLSICLPHQLEAIEFESFAREDGVVVVRSDNLNLRPHDPLMQMEPSSQLAVIGPTVGASSNLVQVGVVGDRFYLYNGYHRATALRIAGATHLPCIVFEADELSEVVGIGGVPARVLRLPTPPTVGHFARRLGHDVQVRRLRRENRISFSIRECVVPAE